MWTTRGGYPRQTLSTKIGPLDMSMGSFDRRYAPVTGWNRYNSIANLRPIGFGTDDAAWAGWKPLVAFTLGLTALALAMRFYGPAPVVPWR
jgi:hypothetical protein